MLAGALLSSDGAEARNLGLPQAGSAEYDGVTPQQLTVPGKPTITAVIPTGGCYIVRWAAPASDGGSAITGYTVDDPGEHSVNPTTVSGSSREATFGNNNCTLHNLAFGMRVKATNTSGDGPWSDEVRQTPAKPVLTAPSVGWATATLSISNHANAPWWYKGDQSGATCTKVAKGTASASISGLDGSTDYTYSAYYDANCPSTSKHGDKLFTTLATPTLAGSSVTHNSATLTISNYSGNWHYKANAAPDASCSTNAVSTTTESLTGLSGNTSYTYKAYSNSGCSTELAAASAFLTKPGKPSKPAAVGSGQLTITASVTGSGAITGWKYQQKKASDSNFGDWQNISSTSESLSYTVSSLTNGDSYQFKVQAVNATGAGPASDASDAATPKAPTNQGSVNPGSTVPGGTIGGDSATEDDDDDDDLPAAIRPNPQSVSVVEGSTASYTVALLRRPKAEVIVSLASDNAAVTASPASLTFTGSNWHKAQTVTLSALADDDLAGGSAVITHTAGGELIDYSGYLDVAAALPVAVSDDDAASIVASVASIAVDEGGTAAYAVALSHRPNGDVTVMLASGNSNIVMISPATLTFTADNWNKAQTVTLAAVEDADLLDNSATITHTARGNGSGYAGVSATVPVAVSDNDVATIQSAATPGEARINAGQSDAGHQSGNATADAVASAVSENVPGSIVLSAEAASVAEGYTATYTVALIRQPSADVTVALASGDNGVVTVWPASLTFTPENWNAAQTVTLAAVEDDDLLDDATDIVHRAASEDAGYAGVTATFSVTSDDTTMFRQLIAAAGRSGPTATPVPPAATVTPIPVPTQIATATPAPAVRVAPTPSGAGPSGSSNASGASPAGESGDEWMPELPMLWVGIAASVLAMLAVVVVGWVIARRRRYGY